MTTAYKISEDCLDDISYKYINLELSTVDIGSEYGVHHSTINRFLDRHGIKKRTVTESMRTDMCRHKKGIGVSEKWKDAEFRDNQSRKKRGKSSGVLGMHWTIDDTSAYRKFGKDNGNWKSGKTKLSMIIRGLSIYREWRNNIFERDDFTCVECGRRSKKGDKVVLHADHITPLSYLLDLLDVHTAEDAISCDQLWDVSNGRTLCRECHRNTDTYGHNIHNAAINIENRYVRTDCAELTPVEMVA